MTDTIIDLIRHGEPVGGRRYRGNRIDDPLSEKGWQQMWQAIPESPPWQHIITSPLARCQAFAEALRDKYGLSLQIEPRFKEVGFGSWEGKTPTQIQQEDLAEYQAFYRDPVNSRPAGAEPLNGFMDRVTQAYDALTATHHGKHILIVAHAGVNRAIVAHTLGAPVAAIYRLKVSNAGLSRIRHGNSPSLELHNSPRLP